MKIFFNLVGLIGILSFSNCYQPAGIPDEKIEGVSAPVITLNGQWHLTPDPPNNFHENAIDYQAWRVVEVPGELVMQGIPAEHDQSYVYKKKFSVPADFNNKAIQLRFDGVYSYAKVWVNGKFITEHFGGFTRWICDITNAVTPGAEAVLTLEVKDLINDISYGSGYAKHPIGGILRDVMLLALPMNYIESFTVETELDEQYQHAELILRASTSRDIASTFDFRLFDPRGLEVQLSQSTMDIKEGDKVGEAAVKIQNPTLWDAEHPNLYTLVVSLFVEEVEVQKKNYSIGFREIEVLGNKLLVNGRPVKLRGANRHDIHPLLGRTTSSAYDEQDVLLAKEANINFIRTSHYPPTDRFLDFCDQYGIYVEDETAVCFVETHRDPAYNVVDHYGQQHKNQFLSQIHEMVNAHRNHPSVILWSIGNESKYSGNFQAAYDYLKSEDHTRPVIFSYPGTVPDTVKCYDILSIHYPNYDGNINQGGFVIEKFENEDMPVIFDEWAHVACYNNATLEVDPSVRNFWGQSLDIMWANLFDSDGGLGGAIWGYIDETFMLPEEVTAQSDWWERIRDSKRGSPLSYAGHVIGYGEWGIIDTWRRKKPEFWNTKKAYSPTKILVKTIEEYTPDEPLRVPVYNRFDHTNFNELNITWEYNGQLGTIKDVDIEPHEKGTMNLPANRWEPGKFLEISFFQFDTVLVDTYRIQTGQAPVSISEITGMAPELFTDERNVHIKGQDFEIRFSKSTGLMEQITTNGTEILSGGPWPNVVADGKLIAYNLHDFERNDSKWKLSEMNYGKTSDAIEIKTEGRMDRLIVNYNFRIYDNGIVKINYGLENLPVNSKIQELGLTFKLTTGFDTLLWNRRGWWSTYPDYHLGKLTGSIPIKTDRTMVYRSDPKQPWEMDNKSFYYNNKEWTSMLTNMTRASKEHVTEYGLRNLHGDGIVIHSEGDMACKIEDKQSYLDLYINSEWDYTNLSWGNYMRSNEFKKEFTGAIVLKITSEK